MQDYGQRPYGPSDHSLDDPLYEPLDPFEDPFETMMNAAFGTDSSGHFGPLDPFDAMKLPAPVTGEGQDRDSLGNLLADGEADIEATPPIRPSPDSICRALGQLEKSVENLPPIRPGPDDVGKRIGQLENNIENSPPIRSEADGLGKILDQLEDNIEKSPPIPSGADDIGEMLARLEKDIEGTSIPPEPEIEVELFEDQGWGYATPSIPDAPPPGIYDSHGRTNMNSSPHAAKRRIGGKRGLSKHDDSGEEKVWCPAENDYIPSHTCEDCEFYESASETCVYDSKHDQETE